MKDELLNLSQRTTINRSDVDQISEICKDYVLDSGQVMFVQIDKQGNVVSCNQAFRRPFNIPVNHPRLNIFDYLISQKGDLTGGFDHHFGQPTLFSTPLSKQKFMFYVYEVRSGFLLFGQLLNASDEVQYSQLADITTTMGNLVQEVKRVNSELKLSNERNLELALKDELTGLANRRFLFQRLNEEVSEAVRYDHPLSLVIIDLDFFKTINDQHGHQVGDQVLHEIGLILLDLTRASDIAARHGGEEFAIVLPETNLQQAYLFSERTRQVIKELSLSMKYQNIRITISAGVAQFDPAESIDQLVSRADHALYVAKENGRDQVCRSEVDT
ncbi:MAG: GGDEF domain-containing protein [Candidatus Thiodiazotropha taylori]|nr:GGDEF domain-containing protein [Candidatus Thiodiazotropha taylori]